MDQSNTIFRTRLGMTFSLKRRRVLIYRATLKEIDDPPYIRLLINKKQKRVAVQSCEEIDKESYEVTDYETWEQFEVTSIKLLQMFYKMTGWDPEKAYRVFGYPVKRCHLVLFCLEEGKETSDNEPEGKIASDPREKEKA